MPALLSFCMSFSSLWSNPWEWLPLHGKVTGVNLAVNFVLSVSCSCVRPRLWYCVTWKCTCGHSFAADICIIIEHDRYIIRVVACLLWFKHGHYLSCYSLNHHSSFCVSGTGFSFCCLSLSEKISLQKREMIRRSKLYRLIFSYLYYTFYMTLCHISFSGRTGINQDLDHS